MVPEVDWLLAVGEGGSLRVVWQGGAAVVGIALAVNVKDCAYRMHAFFMNHGTVGPGPGFSPNLIRFLGVFLAVGFGLTCLVNLASG
ncbi:hypothetical protein ACGFRB_06925 [Streptomyces sp. NPDC048718]|uniref:hypothetical protein n=1 Tax=Streptomyces sp. NPDC048718 TaxID=3365587 RepID=UPI00371E9BE5